MTGYSKLTAAAISALLIGGIAVSAMSSAEARGFGERHGPGPENISFEDLDVDGDGLITTADVEARKAARFAEIDANGDGQLTAEEIAAHAEARMAERAAKFADKAAKRTERMIERNDENGDGTISLAELGGDRADRMFDRLDEDGDGAISAEEFDAMKKRFKGHRGPRGE